MSRGRRSSLYIVASEMKLSFSDKLHPLAVSANGYSLSREVITSDTCLRTVELESHEHT